MKYFRNFSRALGVLSCVVFLALVSIGCGQDSSGGVTKPLEYEPPPNKTQVKAVESQTMGTAPGPVNVPTK